MIKKRTRPCFYCKKRNALFKQRRSKKRNRKYIYKDLKCLKILESQLFIFIKGFSPQFLRTCLAFPLFVNMIYPVRNTQRKRFPRKVFLLVAHSVLKE